MPSLAWDGTEPVGVGLQSAPHDGLRADLGHSLGEAEGERPQQAGKENEQLGPGQVLPQTHPVPCRG